MLANVSYELVRSIAVDNLDYKSNGTFYTDTKQLYILGQYFNIKLSKRKIPFRNFESLPHTAILATNYDKNDDIWHWVIFKRTSKEQFVYDPKKSIKSNKRKDFNRIKAKWYLPVYNQE